MSTTPTARVIWSGSDATGTYRIVDTTRTDGNRFVFERRTGPDGLGDFGWVQVELPLAGILQQALSDLAS